MNPHETVCLSVKPDGLQIRLPRGIMLDEALETAHVALNYPCGRQGHCGDCQVHFESGAPEPDSADIEFVHDELLARGTRLACRARLHHDAVLAIPSEARLIEPQILTSSVDRALPFDPPIRRLSIYLEEAKPGDPGEGERVQQALQAVCGETATLTLDAARELAAIPRAEHQRLTVVATPGQILRIERGDRRAAALGLTVDVGTTTVAASLVSLRTGETIATAARLNPQVPSGMDVISRIGYCLVKPNGLTYLQSRVIRCVNDLIEELVRGRGLDPANIDAITVAGNAVMNHLFLGVHPQGIGLAPYLPAFRHPMAAHARSLGINAHPAAEVLVLPNIGGFVGGDTTAGIVATDFLAGNEPRLLLDLGTNCEIVLAVGDRVLAASAPAGPALEGSSISCGMRAETGAICDIETAPWHPLTIGNAPARGLCGSGLVHVIAALLDAGVINDSGRYAQNAEERALADRIITTASGKHLFRLATESEGADKDVLLKPGDIREFQLARAAIVATWTTLCEIARIDSSAIEHVYIAGAFGNFIRPSAALRTGLVPAVPPERIRYVGNSALSGARLALLSRPVRDQLNTMPDTIQFVELAGRPGFDETFALSLNFSPSY